MATQVEHTVRVSDDQDHHTTGTLYLTTYNPADRMNRALKALGICWLGAGISVFIVIAHWVLVPGLLIAGPIVAMKKYKQTEAKEKVATKCPRCSEQVDVPLEAADSLPKWTYCPSCNGGIRVDAPET